MACTAGYVITTVIAVVSVYLGNVTNGTAWRKLNVQIKAPKQLGKLKLSYKNGYWMT